MNTPILTLMFHRVNDLNLFCPQLFATYLSYLVKNFPIVIPDQPLPDAPLAICLTFDDAYFDFYHHVYPLLLTHQIKALLGVSPGYIIDQTPKAPLIRLKVPYPLGMDKDQAENVPLCTWAELREMAKSQHVIVAAHGFMHANLAAKSTDLYQEIVHAKALLQSQLGQPIRYFIYPFGKMTRQVQRKVGHHYDYGIRIGNALNLGWPKKGQLIYRINADPLWQQQRPIDQKLIKKLTHHYWLNKLRLK